MRYFDTVVVSDLHLGARNAETARFLDFLATVRTDRLIVNGDLFQDPRLRGLRSADVAVLDGLRRYARHADVIFLSGNHDPDATWYEGVLGFPVWDELPIHIGEREYLIYHGHGWDRSLELPGLVIAMADAFYAGSQWLDPSHRLAKALKRNCKTFCSAVKNLRAEAVRTAKERGFDGVILGHTHLQEDLHIDGIHYLNSGCWTERPSGYIGIHHDTVRTYRWDADSLRNDIPFPEIDRVRDVRRWIAAPLESTVR